MLQHGSYRSATVALQGKVKDMPHDLCRRFIDDQVVFLFGIDEVSVRRHIPGEQTVGAAIRHRRTLLFGYVTGVHFIQHIFERGNIIVIVWRNKKAGKGL